MLRMMISSMTIFPSSLLRLCIHAFFYVRSVESARGGGSRPVLLVQQFIVELWTCFRASQKQREQRESKAPDEGPDIFDGEVFMPELDLQLFLWRGKLEILGLDFVGPEHHPPLPSFIQRQLPRSTQPLPLDFKGKSKVAAVQAARMPQLPPDLCALQCSRQADISN